MKAFLNWSGGKDSALCLYRARQEGWEIGALVTTLNASTNRIAMHGVRRSLLEAQAALLGLPLYIIELPEQPAMEDYEKAIHQTNQVLKEKGFTHVVSGDLFLEDLKAYREALYARDELACIFPLWKNDTKDLMGSFISSGFRAIVVCVNQSLIPETFCGRYLDASFVKDLPPTADPCGENGEYHSFVFDGPVFSGPVPFSKGLLTSKTYPAPQADRESTPSPAPPTVFYFCDLLPGQTVEP
ncbi:MAG: Dph6-related ATP pyrophosphatase [Flavisolibacter sp.]